MNRVEVIGQGRACASQASRQAFALMHPAHQAVDGIVRAGVVRCGQRRQQVTGENQ